MFTRSHMAHLPTTIAFFARGREIGYVRLTNGQLVRYGVKTIKGPRRGSAFTQRVEQVLSSVMDRGEVPAEIVVERRGTGSKHGALCRTISTLAKHWKRGRYRVCSLSLDEVKDKLCDDATVTQHTLAEAIVQRYPMLCTLRNQTTDQKTKYWANVCIALALADVAEKSERRFRGIRDLSLNGSGER